MKQLTRRAIVFVAYDLGALIVKNVCFTDLHPGESRLVLTGFFKAISIAGQAQSQWPGIFSRTARFVRARASTRLYPMCCDGQAIYIASIAAPSPRSARLCLGLLMERFSDR